MATELKIRSSPAGVVIVALAAPSMPPTVGFRNKDTVSVTNPEFDLAIDTPDLVFNCGT